MPLIHRPFHRVGIVNRGEAAVRFMRAARAWARRRREPLEVVALFTDAERDALFVREADDAVGLGPAMVAGPSGQQSAYLDIPRVLRLLTGAGCDAVWPGWGFLSERPEFADACAAAGVVFIGPSGESMRLLGDKIAGKTLAERQGVPVTDWSRGPVVDVAEAMAHATRIGCPVLLKAAAGGGGRGIRIVNAPEELSSAFASAAHEARAAFGDATLLVEAFAPEARHVEVQIIADAHGRVHAVGTRDCTMQRRHQKVLEEGPAPGLGALEPKLRAAAIAVARGSGYVSAGTAEFLVMPDLSGFYFLEMNTRLQVEHPVTECVTGLDLVGLQIDVARGDHLPQALPISRGHAIEARLCAEDADAGFRPSAGALLRFDLATGPGVRVDSGFSVGDVVPSAFDSMLAKVIAVGATREEALARLEEALARSTVAIEGGASNRGFLLELLGVEAFRAGPVTTRWLDRHLTTRQSPTERPHVGAALVAAAIGEYRRARAELGADILGRAERGLPSNVPAPEPQSMRLSVGTELFSLEVRAIAPDRYRVSCEGGAVDAGYQPTGRSTALLTLRGRRLSIVEVVAPTALYLEVDGVAHRLERASDGRVLSPVPGAVTAIHVKEGMEVAEGARLFSIEVMKMEVAVDAPFAGRVARIFVEPASRVTAGQPLVLLEGGEAQPTSSATKPRPLGSELPHDAPREATTRLFGALLGYDYPASAIEADLELVRGGRVDVPRAQLVRLLDAYLTHEALFDTAPGADGVAPIDHLARALRQRDGRTLGVPAPFEAALGAALALHDARLGEACSSRDCALLRVLQAHSALDARERILGAVLEASLREEGTESSAPVRDSLRDRLEAFAPHVVRRDQALAEAAYTALYLLCDRPREREEAARLGQLAEQSLEELMSPGATPADRERCTTQLAKLPKGALLSLVRASRLPMNVEYELLGLLVARLYPEAPRLGALGARGAELFGAAPGPLVAFLSTPSTLLDDAAHALAAIPPGSADVLVDAFLPFVSDAELEQLDRLPDALASLPPTVRRLSVNWGNVEVGRLGRTYARGPNGALAELPFHRHFHPERVEAAELARYEGFELERVPGPGELFLAIARSRLDPSDERLLCVAEVERLDPERDPVTAELQRIPSFERVYMTALHGMRDAQRLLRREPKPFWNRLVMFLRPVMRLGREDIRVLTRRLAPASAGLGLEKMIVRGRIREDSTSTVTRPIQIEWANPTNHGNAITFMEPRFVPLTPLRADERRVIEARRKGIFYPYELIRALSRDDDAGPLPRGAFVELELDASGDALEPTSRPHGQNRAQLVVGLVTSYFGPFSDGLRRVLIVGDPTRGAGALAEPECRRILAAFELADREGLPVEWIAVSSGARIAMDSGTENLDWTARVLARIIRFTQAGGTVNVLVDAINVGAQSYWNAEATMLMHCRGTLIMTPQGSMLLTGKRALEYAGSVAAEDNAGIGGYERVMGPNGEAQYFAPNLTAAYKLLFRHLALTAVPPGEARPRRLPSLDPVDRDITAWPILPSGEADGFRTVGEIFDERTNPGRKKPFAIRSVMRAALDADVEPLERWAGWQGAESAVVWEASLGGDPVCCIGIESRPVPRRGHIPIDGPEAWTSGTLFPLSSKKVARAINAASGARPVVVLANLSGFDGSPDSLRHLQLEYGAEIGRAVVNFRGPLVFCVVARYHGGAYVVSSRALSPTLEASALEGSFASVIGGAPAAAVVFPGMVRKRAEADPAVVTARKALGRAGVNAPAAAAEYERVFKEAQARAQAAVAAEFDAVHSVERAYRVGSLAAVVKPAELRPYLVGRVRGAEGEGA